MVWRAQQDPSGREYFLNTETWETRWEVPPETAPDPMPNPIPDWTWPETGFHGFIEFGGRGVTGLTISMLDKVSRGQVRSSPRPASAG